MPQSYVCSFHHIVFSTRQHLRHITADLRQRLYDYMGGIIARENGRLMAAGGTEDHVHLLVSINPQTALSELLRVLKANASKWVHETFPGKRDFAWQDGYGAFSVSFSNVDRVKEYIAGQAEHHRRLSFEEEFMEFLKRHQIPYDERYIWR
ncbi:MAG TPA: IS200/IS605 family transposase [Phycisphaerae bacterium]|nr:IS200/IS605 family transposase [Phycisphaerae bacterium]